jgi:hypothetical protein
LEQEILDGWMVKSAFTHDLQGGGGGGGRWWGGGQCAGEVIRGVLASEEWWQ